MEKSHKASPSHAVVRGGVRGGGGALTTGARMVGRGAEGANPADKKNEVDKDVTCVDR